MKKDKEYTADEHKEQGTETRTLKEYYADMKSEVMSEEDIKLTDKYVEYFKSSWYDKDNRELFDKWEKIDQYWEGDANLPESDEDPASNTNIINPHVEGQVALCTEPDMAVQADPVEPSDAPFTDHAQIIGQFIIDKNKMKKKMDIAVRRLKKFGAAIFTVMFNPDLLDGMGLPWIKSWNPAYVFFDPNVTDITEIHNGRFEILICNKSIHWAGEMFGEELADAIMPGYHPIESEYIYGEDEGENDELSRDNYLHLFVITRKKEKVRIVQMSGCGIKLWDSEEEKDIVLPDWQMPVFVAPDMPREGTAYAKASAELLTDQQDLVNDLDDQMRINARLMGNIQKVVGTASGIDIDKWTNEAGLNIPAADPQAWMMVQPREMPQYIQERRNYAMNIERPIVSRFSDQMNGIQQRGVDTATEALTLQQSGLAGVDHTKLIIQETLGEALEYAFELAKENWTSEEAFKITGEKVSFLWYNPSKLKSIPRLMPASEDYKQQFRAARMADGALPEGYSDPEMMIATGADKKPITKNAKFDMKVSIGAGIPQNKAFRYTVVKEAYTGGAMDIPEYRQKLRDLGAMKTTSADVEAATVAKLENLKMLQASKAPAGGDIGTAMGDGSGYGDIQGLSAKGRPTGLQNAGGARSDSFGTKA